MCKGVITPWNIMKMSCFSWTIPFISILRGFAKFPRKIRFTDLTALKLISSIGGFQNRLPRKLGLKCYRK